MNEFPQALYRMPGAQTALVHDAEQRDAHFTDGWHASEDEAQAALDAEEAAKLKAAPPTAPVPPAPAAPTRAEFEQKAKELGLKFDGRTTDAKLGEAIDAKLKA
jgi:hypothetical protein